MATRSARVRGTHKTRNWKEHGSLESINQSTRSFSSRRSRAGPAPHNEEMGHPGHRSRNRPQQRLHHQDSIRAFTTPKQTVSAPTRRSDASNQLSGSSNRSCTASAASGPGSTQSTSGSGPSQPTWGHQRGTGKATAAVPPKSLRSGVTTFQQTAQRS